MQSIEEVEMNVLRFENKEITDELKASITSKKKHLHIDYWCEHCGRCVERCKQGALSLADDKVTVDNSKCVLCGYCGSVCPQFAIKIC
jgi:ferredoxin